MGFIFNIQMRLQTNKHLTRLAHVDYESLQEYGLLLCVLLCLNAESRYEMFKVLYILYIMSFVYALKYITPIINIRFFYIILRNILQLARAKNDLFNAGKTFRFIFFISFITAEVSFMQYLK